MNLRISRKFLLIFSVCTIAAGGIVWACSDDGYDDSLYSNLTPEAFVDQQYAPFFYASSVSYYGYAEDDSNRRYNEIIIGEWEQYLDHKIPAADLKLLLCSTSLQGIDSVRQYTEGNLQRLPLILNGLKGSRVNKTRLADFLSYLSLAKAAESFAVKSPAYYWDEKVTVVAPDAGLEVRLQHAFTSAKDAFVKERLWFQLVRFAYFKELAAGSGNTAQSQVVSIFNEHAAAFPKNTIYYRALGYLAGHYYKSGDYARANYLYSLGYDFSSAMKIPSKWSFHPQEETDWQRSLAMAKTPGEQITLWQMLGLQHDEARAIQEIYAIDPRSEKLDLLLSRLINKTELNITYVFADSLPAARNQELRKQKELVGSIARANRTSKPYFWNLAAGYLNTLTKDYPAAEAFYGRAKKQLPAGNKLLAAQYRILEWTLYLAQLKHIGPEEETQMTANLNWLADLRDRKDSLKDLRYNAALDQSITVLASLYAKQGELLKSNCFSSKTAYYADNDKVEQLKELLLKQKKSPFELAMLRYFPLTASDLYYHQGLMLTYREKTDQAIAMMEKSGKNAQFQLLANPFSIHINDCHDCDFDAVQQVKFTPLSFLREIKRLKTAVAEGKNAYVNTFLLADAYYNITHYGNARTFYQNAITGSSATSPLDIAVEFRPQFASSKLAEKYYLQARSLARTREQKTRCTFMAAKCERNEVYNANYFDKTKKHKYYWEFDLIDIPAGKYFAELKKQYFQTRYYQEILKECGYFRKYADKR